MGIMLVYMFSVMIVYTYVVLMCHSGCVLPRNEKIAFFIIPLLPGVNTVFSILIILHTGDRIYKNYK